MVPGLGSAKLYGWFWISTFAATEIYWLAALAVSSLVKRPRLGSCLFALNIAALVYCLAFFVLLHFVAGVTWLSLMILAALVIVISASPMLLIRSQPRAFHQMTHTIVGFVSAGIQLVIASLTHHPLWYAGSAILVSIAVMNVNAEYVVRPGLGRLYLDPDDEILTLSPILREEAPMLMLPMLALLFFPATLPPIPLALLHRAYGLIAVLAAALFMLTLALALFGALSVTDEVKRTVVSRFMMSVSLQIAIALCVGLVAVLMPDNGNELRISGPDVTTGAAEFFPMEPRAASQLFLWTLVMASLIGVVASVYMATIALTRPPAYDLFVSFSAKDRDTATDLVRLAEREGLRVFFSDEAIYSGERFRDKITSAIRRCRQMVVLMTPNSVTSDWVRYEWTGALAIGKRVSPILLGITPQDLPGELERLSVVDYSLVGGWMLEEGRRGR